MNNYLISLNNELTEIYKKLQLNNDIDLFIEDLKPLLYFYIKSVTCCGINVVKRRLRIKDLLNDIDKVKNDEIEFNNDINYVKDNINDFEQILNYLVESLIYVYRKSQLLEYKENSFNEIIVITDNSSCDKCKTISKQKHTVDYLIDNLDRSCALCYIKYDITTDINKSILNKVKFSNSELITDYNFILVSNIYEIPNIKEQYSQEELDVINENFVSIQNNNDVYINNEYTNTDYLIVKYSIQDKLEVNEYWIEKYNNSKKYINYIAMKNAEQYFVENVIMYILQPNILKQIDNENYEKIKVDIFNNIEIN
jgi:hypothetical protein